MSMAMQGIIDSIQGRQLKRVYRELGRIGR
jgi:hypothetical protein